MANSFIDPALVRMSLPEGPGWEWNPGQTFVTAFNNAQENKRLQEKAELDNWMTQQLFPYKKALAELELQKLQNQVEIGTLSLQRVKEYDQQRHSASVRLLNSLPSSGNVNTTPRGQGLFRSLIEQTDSQIPLPQEDEDLVTLE